MTSGLKQRSLGFNYGMAVVLGSGGFYMGYHIGIFNPLTEPLLYGVYKLDPIADKEKVNLYKGFIFMLFSLGTMVGVFASGFLADKFGRRTILYAGEIIALLNIGLYWVEDLRFLMAARTVAGVAAGVNTSAFSVIMAELLPSSVIGFGNAFSYTMITAAILLGYLPLVLMTNQQMVDYWRYLVLGSTLISVLRLALFPKYIKSETPKYIFTSLVNPEHTEDLVYQAYSILYEDEAAKECTKNTLQMFEKQREEGQVSFGTLFTRRYIKRLVSGCLVAFANQMSGINFLIFFSASIFSSMPKTITMTIGVSNFGGSFLAMYFIGKMGRKFNLVIGALGQGLSLTGLYFGFNSSNDPLMIASVCLYITFFAIGSGGTTTAYISEILPAIGIGVALALQWILTAIVGQVVPPLVEIFGPTKIIMFFAIMSFSLFFSLDCLMIETKGKTESMVEQEFLHRSYKFLNLCESEPRAKQTDNEETLNNHTM